MKCSVTRGYVYRGRAVPALAGVYIFGDLCTGGVFALRSSAEQAWSSQLELGYQPIKISSFGEDAAGEMYVADRSTPVEAPVRCVCPAQSLGSNKRFSS